MKKLALLLILCLVSVMAGCCSTLTESAAERNTRYRDITQLNARMAVEDWDYLWLYERESMLTQWHPHAGF